MFGYTVARLCQTRAVSGLLILELGPPPTRISAPLPSPPFCGRVMRQQRMYSFRRVVLDLYIVSVCEHV